MTSLTPVAHAHGAGCVGLVLALLRGADIPAFVDILHTGHLLSVQSIALNGMIVSVPKSHAAQAHELLAAVGPFQNRPLSIARRVLLAALFLSFGGGITPWAMFPKAAPQSVQMRVLDSFP